MPSSDCPKGCRIRCCERKRCKCHPEVKFECLSCKVDEGKVLPS